MLEVLIAFVIAAMALAVLFRGAVEGEAVANVADHYAEALSRARSHLAAIDAAGPPTASDQSGDDGGGFRWRVRIFPVRQGTPGTIGVVPMLFAVSVTVSWQAAGRDRVLQLDTRRLGTAPPKPP